MLGKKLSVPKEKSDKGPVSALGDVQVGSPLQTELISPRFLVPLAWEGQVALGRGFTGRCTG